MTAKNTALPTGQTAKADCFLIADEVGLGKTLSAKTVLQEIARRKSPTPVHAIYVASSVDLAAQNMREFLTEYGDWQANYEGLKGFQKANACKALQVFYGDSYPATSDTGSCKAPGKFKSLLNVTDTPRLSMYDPETMVNDTESFVMQLSPKTSFFIPGEKASGDLNAGYTGSQEEIESLLKDFTDLQNNIGKLLKNQFQGQSILNLELCPALIYHCHQKSLFKNAVDKNSAIKKKLKTLCEKLEKLRQLKAKAETFEDAKVSAEVPAHYRYYFYEARRIRSNASAALFKPDLIILDEFQSYRSILESTFRGYSIPELYTYLKWRYKKSDPNYRPRILLLSATPYNFNPDALESTLWQDPMSAQKKSGKTQDAYENFDELRKRMIALGAAADTKDQVARTERRFAHTPAPTLRREIPDKKMLALHQVHYMVPIFQIFEELCKKLSLDVTDPAIGKDLDTFSRAIGFAPEFWRFTLGYDKLAVLNNEKLLNALLARDFTAGLYDPLANVGMQQLKQTLFPTDDSLPRLWVPPVRQGQPGTGKALVFTQYVFCTRSVAYFADQVAWARVEACTAFDNLHSADLDQAADYALHICLWVLGERPLKEYEDALRIYRRIRRKQPLAQPLKEYQDALRKALRDFFDRSFVRHVLAAYAEKQHRTTCCYPCTVRSYCEDYDFQGMLEEFKLVCQATKKDFPTQLLAMFAHLPSSIAVQAGAKNKKEFYDPTYSEMFVCDDDKSGDSSDKVTGETGRTGESIQEICNHFNSPLYPMVMVARSSAQEGFNLQNYGDKLMHWQTADNVNAFLQRQGRLDRPNSLIFRHKVWHKIKGMPDAAQQFAKILTEKNDAKYNVLGLDPEDTALGLAPLWSLPCDDAGIHIRELLPLNPNGDIYERFTRQLDGAEKYSDFNPDLRTANSTAKPTNLCPYFDPAVSSAIKSF